ncbi:MAG: hypothetical protein ACJ8GN_22590 [Longimicrobiaceae bacterium]
MAKPFRWYLPRGALAAVAVAAAALACTDRSNPAGPGHDDDPGGAGGGTAIPLAQLVCSASVSGLTVSCTAPKPDAGDARADIVYGGQDVFVVSTTSSVNYNAATHKFTFNLNIRNLLRQAIGTTNGVAADPSGVKVFFHQPPTVTSGTGVITVDNSDGAGTFTATGQQYYQYIQLIEPYAQSANKLWQFDVPATAAAFEFKLLISSPVQFPTGWIDVSEPTYALSRTYSKTLFGVVRDQFGQVIPGAVITWNSVNPAIATITPGGEVTGVLPGAVDLVASSTNNVPGTTGASQTGAGHFTITGTSLVWTAGAGTTDWNTPGNWDRGVSPVAEDSATIPVVGVGIYPVFTANQSIGRIDVADAAAVHIGPFDLTASQDVLAGLSGGITSTTGRVLMTGIAKTTSGLLPRMRVSGTYSLAGNVNSTASLRVESGRIRSTGFRIRVVSQ